MEEEEVSRVGVPAAPARRFEPEPTRIAPPSRPMRAEKEPMAPVGPRTSQMRSMNRCPICGHKLLASGECFHCKMDQMYGR